MSTDPDKALRRLRERATARPADPLARAELCAALANTDEADRCLDETRALIDNSLRLGAHDIARRAADYLFESLGDPAWAVLAAEASLLAGDTEAGRSRLESLAAQFPESPEAPTRLAALALGEGDAPAAVRWIEPVATASSETRVLYVQALMAAQAPAEALEFALDSAEAYPDSADQHLLVGLAQLANERPRRAVSAFSEALRLDPTRPEIPYNLAIAFALDGAVAAAIGVIDAALAARPRDGMLHALRAELRSRLKV